MMRKIFGGTMMLSIVGAIVLGGAFAWNNSQTTSEQTIKIGTVAWTLHYEQENTMAGPNDGVMRTIGDGWIRNTGNFGLQIVSTSGSTGSQWLLDHATSTCAVDSYYNGAVNAETGGTLLPGQTGNPDETTGVSAGRYHVKLGLDPSMPNSCVGGTVAYTVLVNVQTAN